MSAGGAGPSVYLIGPRGSGKTALGRVLASALECSFVDADEEMERRAGRRIADWLPADEPGFRAAEARLLQELLQLTGHVVALGGGVVEDPASCAALETQSLVVALRAEPQELVRRQRGGDRPALTGLPLEEEVRSVFERRRAAYDRAARGHWIDTTGGLDEASAKLAALVARMRRDVC